MILTRDEKKLLDESLEYFQERSLLEAEDDIWESLLQKLQESIEVTTR
jgi:hypothetical protein